AAVESLKKEGLTALFHQLDISDVLINNAGIAFKGRIVNVSSVMGSEALSRCSPELQACLRNNDITEEELVGLMERFVRDAQEGVLAEILARNLTKERPGDEILCNACCPGWVRTGMAGPNATKSPDEGAITPVYLALLPAGAKEPHGQFVSEKKVQPW
uniref:Carbonyl reductase 1 n=1 Tax=Sinocyclocheilus grahami TaxID=75366 RepID=A0A672Q4A0_SINGR